MQFVDELIQEGGQKKEEQQLGGQISKERESWSLQSIHKVEKEGMEISAKQPRRGRVQEPPVDRPRPRAPAIPERKHEYLGSKGRSN